MKKSAIEDGINYVSYFKLFLRTAAPTIPRPRPRAHSITAGVVTMTSVAKIIRLFQSAADKQSKVDGPPNDDHTLIFKEDLLNVTFQIRFKGTDSGDPSGAIFSNAKYKATNATAVSYDRQVAACANYDASILDNDPARSSKE